MSTRIETFRRNGLPVQLLLYAHRYWQNILVEGQQQHAIECATCLLKDDHIDHGTVADLATAVASAK